MAASPCSHLSSVLILEGPDEVDGCDTCLVEGGTWLHLRMCMTCGEVGCCDDSPGQHARRHAATAEHPVIRSIEPGESWSYCYVDDAVFHVAGTDVVEPEPLPHTFNHDRAGGRIDLWVGDEMVGRVQYTAVGEAINLTSTEVFVGHRGRGHGGELVLETIRVFSSPSKPLIPSCEFARSYIAARPQLHDAVAPRMRGRLLGGTEG